MTPMKLNHHTRVSILVIIVAAGLLELNTIVDFVSTRRSFNEQLTEKAQRDLNESHRMARADQKDDLELLALIEARVEKEKPHQQPDFDAEALARLLDVTPLRLSRLFPVTTLQRNNETK